MFSMFGNEQLLAMVLVFSFMHPCEGAAAVSELGHPLLEKLTLTQPKLSKPIASCQHPMHDLSA